jgi:penicillin-binding protein 1A
MLERAVNEGTGAALRSRYGLTAEIAGKTGTSQDFGDAWFVAYTPKLVIGTWVGASERSIHFNSNDGSGSQLALPIAGEVLSSIARDRKWRKRTFVAFDPSIRDTTSMDCGGHWTGADQFFEDLFGKKKQREDERRQRDSLRKADPRNFWERMFPKDKKKGSR